MGGARRGQIVPLGPGENTMADELQCIFSLLSKELVEDVLRLSDGNGEAYVNVM